MMTKTKFVSMIIGEIAAALLVGMFWHFGWQALALGLLQLSIGINYLWLRVIDMQL